MKTYRTITRVLTAAAVVCSTIFMSGCGNDLTDEIDELKKRVGTIEDALETLEEKVAEGCMIEDIVPLPGGLGWRVVFTGDRTPIEILNGTAGVIPLIEVRANGDEGYSVWYNVTSGYPEDGWVNTMQDLTGPAGLPPAIRVKESGGKITVQYNITPGYPESGWVDTGVDLKQPAAESPIASITNNADGTVTFTLNSFGSPSYTFAKFSTAQHIEIMTVGPVVFDATETLDIVFRVNPSTAFVPTGAATAIARWSLDEVAVREVETRASYVTPTDVFAIERISADGDKKGQYVARIASNHLEHSADTEEYHIAMVLNNNSGETVTPDDALVSSGVIVMKITPPVEEEPVAQGVIGDTNNITWKLMADGTMTFTGTGAMPNYGMFPAPPWNANKSTIGTVTIGEGITNVGNNAFSGCANLTAATLSSTLTNIGNSAFANCSKLETVNIPDGVTGIGDYAFSDCVKLTTITLPSGLKTIGSQGFVRTGLTSVVIPDSVTSLGTSVFMGCASLADVTIGSGLTTIANYVFQDCRPALTSVTIPGTIKTIGNNAFDGCRNLAAVTIENGVESIGNTAFRYCVFSSLTLPGSLKSIGSSAFQSCENLTGIVIPDNVTTLGLNAFNNCTGLASMTIGSGVNTLLFGVTSGCGMLTSVTVKSPTLVDNSAGGNFPNTNDTLYVPATLVDTYKGEDAWVTVFNSIEAIP